MDICAKSLFIFYFSNLSHTQLRQNLFIVLHLNGVVHSCTYKLNLFCMKLVGSPSASHCFHYINRVARNNDTMIHRLFISVQFLCAHYTTRRRLHTEICVAAESPIGNRQCVEWRKCVIRAPPVITFNIFFSSSQTVRSLHAIFFCFVFGQSVCTMCSGYRLRCELPTLCAIDETESEKMCAIIEQPVAEPHTTSSFVVVVIRRMHVDFLIR